MAGHANIQCPWSNMPLVGTPSSCCRHLGTPNCTTLHLSVLFSSCPSLRHSTIVLLYHTVLAVRHCTAAKWSTTRTTLHLSFVLPACPSLPSGPLCTVLMLCNPRTCTTLRSMKSPLGLGMRQLMRPAILPGSGTAKKCSCTCNSSRTTARRTTCCIERIPCKVIQQHVSVVLLHIGGYTICSVLCRLPHQMKAGWLESLPWATKP